MELLERFINREKFKSYEDFKENFELKVPDNFDYARDVVDVWAACEPNRTALVYCNDDGYEKIISFSELSALSKRAASFLSALGVKKGDRVVSLLRRRYEYWIVAIALHRLGAVIVPCSVQMRAKDLAYRINACSAVMVVGLDDTYVMQQLEGMKKKCHCLQNIIMVGERLQGKYLNFNEHYLQCEKYEGYSGLANEDEFIIYFTSGTSGNPKMAIHNRMYPLAHIVTAKYMQCVVPGGLHLTQSDSGWAKFGWGNMYGQFICGTAVLAYDPERFDALSMLEIVKKYKVTSMCVPPTMYRLLLRANPKKAMLKSVKWFSTAGEPLSDEVNRKFYELSGKYIHIGYGQSEGTPLTCTFSWLEVHSESMGKPSPLYDLRIIDDMGEECAPNVHGEVVVRLTDKTQLGLLTAYCINKKYSSPVKDNIYHTGDIAYRDDEGYFWFVGRNDDIIKSSGYRIGPFEIESVLNSHPAVKECVIIGRPDPVRGQVICAVIGLNEGYEPSDELTSELQQFVKDNTAPYKYPRIVEYTDEALPKTTSGKLIRKAMK